MVIHMKECSTPHSHKPLLLSFPEPTSFLSVTLATAYSNSKQAEEYQAI